MFVRWIAPPRPWAQLNTDGSSKDNPGHAGGGGLIRNDVGHLLVAYAKYCGLKISVEAKALAPLDGLKLCKQRNLDRVWVEVDSLLLVQMIQGVCDIPWNNTYIFREIITSSSFCYYDPCLQRSKSRS